jgi:hypothetical protein
MSNLTLNVLDGPFAVCKLSADEPIPKWAADGGFVSITRTFDELSICCQEGAVPKDIACERGWRCLRVAGTLPFSAVGILARLTVPLAEAGVGVFAISTFDTDYLLVKEMDFPAALDALARNGYLIR